MSECSERFKELTKQIDVVLDEDLPALRRMSERSRIERYNDLKSREEEFIWQFSEDCSGFLTEAERSRVRGNFRLARLLIAASFYSENEEVPHAMADDFVEAELEAVVEFDRYRQFDALSEEQIEEKIRRMEGEVYELVEEYTSTQLANIDQFMEHPEVQQDLMERLLERYETRREKIRRGFFTYVETHGIEHMVAAIEEAVEAVNDASAERERVGEELADRTPTASATDTEVITRQRLESEIQRLESEFGQDTADTAHLESEIEQLRQEITELAAQKESATADVDAEIERTTELENRLEVKISELEDAREQAIAEATEEAGQQAQQLVENELEQLRQQREQVRQEMEQLQREREQIAAARDSLDRKQDELEQEVAQIQQSVQTNDSELDGSNVVSAKMAKLLEMDYLGRFDISMHEADEIQTKEEQFAVPDGYWEGRSYRQNNRSYLLGILEDDNPDNYPVNETSRYEITSSGPLGLGEQTEMVIDARVVSNLHAYAANGFDSTPADLDALIAIVNEVVAEAEDGEYTYLLGLASPTGWSEQVREQVQNDGFSNTRYSRHVSLCLINLQDGSMIYDDSDPVLRENTDLFAPPIDSERLEQCVKTVRDEYVDDLASESVLLRDVVNEHGYEPQTVKRAFGRLEEKGVGEQLYLDELGLSLNFGT